MTTLLRRTRGQHREQTSVARSMLTSLVAVLGAVAIGVLGAGTTFAYLNATADVAAATTVSAGTANFSVAATSPLVNGNLTPGAVVYGYYTVTNSGDVKLAITPTVSATSGNSSTLGNTTLELGLVADGTNCTGVSYTWSKVGSNTASGSLAALAARDRLVGSTATPTMRLCARTTLSSGAPVAAAGGTVSYNISLDGSQTW